MWNQTLALVSHEHHSNASDQYSLAIETLNPNDIATLVNELHEVKAKWYDLGVQLRMKIHDLDAIEIECLKNCDRCLIKMLSSWLSQTDHSPTWQIVVDALSSPAIGNQNAANRIHQVYCKPGPDLPQASGILAMLYQCAKRIICQSSVFRF